MRMSVVAPIVMLLLVALMALSFFSSYERRVEREYFPAKAEVNANKILALSEWLSRLGYQVERIQSLSSVSKLKADSVFIVPEVRGEITDSAVTKVVRFVEVGGHLLLEADSVSSEDKLLNAFDIKQKYDESYDTDSDYEDIKDPEWFVLTDSYDIRDPSIVQVRMQNNGPVLSVYLPGYRTLSAKNPLRVIRSKRGVQLIQIEYGRGLVTVMTDASLMTNNTLGRNDNAEFFWQLINTGTPKQQVVFFRSVRINFFQWLWRHARAALFVAAVWGVLWLWYAMPRLGPLLPDPKPVRRRLLAHLEASGIFWWRAHFRIPLIKVAARMVMNAVYRSYPHLTVSTNEAKAQFMVQKFGLASSLAEQIVGMHGNVDGADLIKVIQGCSVIYQNLAHKPGSKNGVGI
jgi:hypothetical protein